MSDNRASWSLRYEMGNTQWDLGRPHPDLVERLAADATLGCGRVGTVVVPGCGSGHDAAALADGGWNVIALDFASAARPLVEAKLAGRGVFVEADLFLYEPPEEIEFVFDHTCFCAISPDRRADFGETMSRWLNPGGLFISVVFPMGKPVEHGGPPHSMSVEGLTEALGDAFELEVASEADCAGRRWDSRWAAFRRR